MRRTLAAITFVMFVTAACGQSRLSLQMFSAGVKTGVSVGDYRLTADCYDVYKHRMSGNGVNGRRFTGTNGNSIFLPAAGSRLGSEVIYAAKYGPYWSSSLYTDDPYDAWDCYFGSGHQSVSGSGRGDGRAVRAVRASQN